VGGRLTLDPTTYKGDARRILRVTRKILSDSPSSFLVYATDGAAPQGDGNNLEHWYATAMVAYHQGSEVRHSERLIGTKAGDLLAAPRPSDSGRNYCNNDGLASKRKAGPGQPHYRHKLRRLRQQASQFRLRNPFPSLSRMPLTSSSTLSPG
jgi:hypothetical protein